MSEEKPIPDLLCAYSGESMIDSDRVVINLNVDALAKNREMGTAILRGYLEERKQEILLLIQAKRKRDTNGRVIVPSGIPLKVV